MGMNDNAKDWANEYIKSIKATPILTAAQQLAVLEEIEVNPALIQANSVSLMCIPDEPDKLIVSYRVAAKIDRQRMARIWSPGTDCDPDLRTHGRTCGCFAPSEEA